MLYLSSLVISSLVFLCSVFVPAEFAAKEEKLSPEEPHYFDTVYATDDGPMPIDLATTYIPYITKTQSAAHMLAIRCPAYTYAPALGCCAAIAGGNVLGYYDRFDENLIPDHNSGRPISNTYIYSSEDDGVEAAIDKLYEYMTGSGYGATEDDFIRGLTRYCNEKGKTINFSSCMQGGSFSYSVARSYMDANQPVVLFLSGYNVSDLYPGENRDTVSYYVSSANHIMIGFGYESYIYNTSDGTVNYNFISVASGLDLDSSGLYDINFQTKINDALAVNIY